MLPLVEGRGFQAPSLVSLAMGSLVSELESRVKGFAHQVLLEENENMLVSLERGEGGLFELQRPILEEDVIGDLPFLAPQLAEMLDKELSPLALDIMEEASLVTEYSMLMFEGLWEQHCVKMGLNLKENLNSDGKIIEPWKFFFLKVLLVKQLKEVQGDMSKIEEEWRCLYYRHREEFTSLNLTSFVQMTDSQLAEVLSFFSSVVDLNLSHCTKLTDEGFVSIGELDLLERLAVRATCFSVKGALGLKACTSLKELDVSECQLVNDTALMHIAHIPLLENLNLSSCEGMTERAFLHFASSSYLRSLNLYRCTQLGESAISFIAKIPVLQHLGLGDLRVSDFSLEYLERAYNLQSLDLSGAQGYSANGLSYLHHLSKLNLSRNESLDLSSLIVIGSLSCLRSLNLSHSPLINDDAVARLESLSSLQELNLSYCPKITGAIGVVLSALSALQDLSLDYCDGIDAELAELWHPSMELERLSLKDTHLNEAALCLLVTRCPCLKILDLSRALFLNGTITEMMQTAVCLEEFYAQACDTLNDGAVLALCLSPALHTVDFSFCDSLTDEVFSAFEAFPSLEVVSMHACSGISDEVLQVDYPFLLQA